MPADNVVLNANVTTGSTISADNIAGVLHQNVKVEYGDLDLVQQVSAVYPLPVLNDNERRIDEINQLYLMASLMEELGSTERYNASLDFKEIR